MNRSYLYPRSSTGASRRYKYIVVMDGNTAPTARSLVLMYSGSAMFRQESLYYEFWYSSLIPYVHYVPISFDGTDIAQKVEWARQHDKALSAIASNAQSFAKSHLNDDHVSCYWHRLLVRYAALQSFKPSLSADFRRVVLDEEKWEVDHLRQTDSKYCDLDRRFRHG